MSDCDIVYVSDCDIVYVSDCDMVHVSDCDMVHVSDCDMVHVAYYDMVHVSDCDMVHVSDCDMVRVSDCDMVHVSDCDMVHVADFLLLLTVVTQQQDVTQRPESPLLSQSEDSNPGSSYILHPPLPAVATPTPPTATATGLPGVHIPLLLNPDILQSTTIPYISPQVSQVLSISDHQPRHSAAPPLYLPTGKPGVIYIRSSTQTLCTAPPFPISPHR